MSDAPDHLTSTDRRDMSALRQLRRAVFEKREAFGGNPHRSVDDRNRFDKGFLQLLYRLASPHPHQLLTDLPTSMFEVAEEGLGHLSETYPEEIDQLRQILDRTQRRWLRRCHQDPTNPAFSSLITQVIVKAWLGDLAHINDREPPGDAS
jgi:hypothetical protein